LTATQPSAGRLRLIIAVLVLAGACSATAGVPIVSEQTPTPAQPTRPPTATPDPAIGDDADPTPTPTQTPDSSIDVGLVAPDFAGMVTATGVPVAVLTGTADGFLVRTPCGNQELISGGEPIESATVVIDPGHGGPVDTGAVGPTGLVERDINLTLSLALESELADRGIPAALTRTGDYPVLLSVRAAFADQLGAELMVSIHHNSPIGDPSDTPGTEVFVQSGSDSSARLGGLLYEEVTAALATFDLAWTAAPDAGVLRVLLPDGNDAYGMIRRPITPTALVELGYLANPAEAALFATDEYIDVASSALADAIEAHLVTDRPGTGFGNPPRMFRPDRAPGADLCDEPLLE